MTSDPSAPSEGDPLRRLERELASLGPEHLGRRLTLESLPEELVPVVLALNALLARLQDGFDREQRLASALAHELRTPVTELRLLANRRLDEERPELREVREIAEGMDRRISLLLAIGGHRAAAPELERREVDLCPVVRAAFGPFSSRAATRRITSRFRLPKSAPVETEPSLLEAILGNLFENAVEHCPERGSIECAVVETERGFTFSLENTNDRLTPPDLAHLCEPLWRKHSEAAHRGLGLWLVLTCARHLSLELDLSLPRPDLFRVSLEPPAR